MTSTDSGYENHVMPLYPIGFWSFQSSVWHLPYVFRRRSTGFPSSCSWPLFLQVSNVAFEYRSCLQAGWLFLLRVHFWVPSSRAHLWPPFPCTQRRWIFHIPYRTFYWALLAYMESAVTHFTLTFMSFCCRRIPSLNALNEMYSMNDMPSICILLTFLPNSTDFISLSLTMGRT